MLEIAETLLRVVIVKIFAGKTMMWQGEVEGCSGRWEQRSCLC